MNQLVIDIWPYLIPVLLGAVVWQWRENHALKIRVAVLENTVENLETTLVNIQKRQDSQSKKQDDILDRISAMESGVLKEVGSVKASISGLAADLNGLSRLILASDKGIKIERAQ
jgi:predicted  nucleic acid-binding Zn-ribbon protein